MVYNNYFVHEFAYKYIRRERKRKRERNGKGRFIDLYP